MHRYSVDQWQAFRYLRVQSQFIKIGLWVPGILRLTVSLTRRACRDHSQQAPCQRRYLTHIRCGTCHSSFVWHEDRL